MTIAPHPASDGRARQRRTRPIRGVFGPSRLHWGAVQVDVASLQVVHYPHAALRVRAEPLERVTDAVRAVARRMIELMHEEEGIGLAATQVALPWRMFVAFVPPNDEDRRIGDHPATALERPVVFINPVVEAQEGYPEPFEERCLSLPDIRGDVLRPPVVTVRATDVEGAPFTVHAAGLLARCLQHEIDHLDGVLIIDRMTPMSRLRNRAALRDLERDAGTR